ncbi:hypothetical protein GCM10011378_08260 [Hymenobacter glacieicola]|uniref:Toxin-antitoxin system HicB family antitoxin n=1 Tax=Hymenobacter glacieicola TaxID=1562124 RepID=A0ABQ1WKE4_9BACT|nr:hypothetical protein GCM10011378_08260 [Hymenobacter glacieicola]
MLTIKVNLSPENEAAIRSQAAKAGVPINAYVAPFLNAVADRTLQMVPLFPAPVKSQS